jgi:hypothetical protein
LLVSCFAASSPAQKIKLANRIFPDENSKTVYIGMENRFVVQPEVIETILENELASVNDSVVTIRPNKPGKLTITFLSEGEKVPVEFEAKHIPKVKVTIAGGDKDPAGKEILSSKSELLLADRTGDDKFFDQFEVTSFQATIGGETFDISGNKISSELLARINKTKDPKLYIHSVRATSPSGYSINAGINQTIAFF